MTLDTETRRFLTALHVGGAYGYWWTVEGRRSFWWEVGKMTPLPDGKRNIYFGVHPTTEIPTTNARGEPKPSSEVRSQNALIAAIAALFVEYDAKDYDGDKDAALRKVESLYPPPSVVVDSGGGYHSYWLLDKPWLLDDDTREKARKLQAAWVRLMDGDPQSKDLARVLRVPGTLNHKYQPPRPVAFVWPDTGARYAIDELAALAEPFVESDARQETRTANGDHGPWLTAALAGEIAKVVSAPDGKKHDRLRDSAIALGGLVNQGLSEQTIEDGLYAAIEPRAADARGAHKTIQDGIAYGKARPRKGPQQQEQRQASNGTAPAEKPDGKHEAGKGGSAEKHSVKMIRALGELGYAFALNLCNNTIEVNGEPMTDELKAQIRVDARDNHLKPLSAIEDVYVVEAVNHAYHPIRDYLNGLVWDKEQRIALLANALHGSDPPVVYENGVEVPLVHVYLWRWMIGAVAKAFDGHQNMMLVLAGPQRTGKSHLARWLSSGIPNFFLEAPINVTDKDSDVRLISHFLWEVSELDATTRKADVSALKAFITKKIVTVRKAYGHHDTRKPALASLIGTVNESTGFLSDDTGNRRFLVASVNSIDWHYTSLDIGQLWAEAVAAYRAGETWELHGPEAEMQEQQNKQHETETILEDWIRMHFDLPGNDDMRMTAGEIVDHLRKAHDIRLNGSERAQTMELARVLTRLGVKKLRISTRTTTWRGYVGIMPKSR